MAEAPTSTIYLLKRAELAVRGCVEAAFGAVGLTPNEYFALLLVKSGEASSSAELARAMGVKPQSMTELIASLTDKGAIERRPDPDNHRILRIGLTATGERLHARATEAAIPVEQELLSGFSARALAGLNEALTELTTKAERGAPNARSRALERRATKAVARDGTKHREAS